MEFVPTLVRRGSNLIRL